MYKFIWGGRYRQLGPVNSRTIEISNEDNLVDFILCDEVKSTVKFFNIMNITVGHVKYTNVQVFITLE
jgi:hypothetical protein